MQTLRFLEVFKAIDDDCKYVSGSKYTEFVNKKELIIPMLFTELQKMTFQRDYYILKYIYEYQACTSPSSITKFEVINDYISENNLYPEYHIERRFKYHDIVPEITNLNTNFTNVLKTTVIEMNVWSPVICGQFFENMISLACDLDITQEFNPGPNLCEKPDDVKNLIDSLKENNEYKTIYHKNLAMCLFTQLVHGTDMTNYFHEFIYIRNLLLSNDLYIEQLDNYLIELKKTIIGRFKFPKKSIKVYREPDGFNEYTSGEADIITDDMVVDIKCYKTEPLKLWKYQLEIYNNMIERPRKKMMIINLLNNKVYTWNITFDDVYEKITNEVNEPLIIEEDETSDW